MAYKSNRQKRREVIKSILKKPPKNQNSLKNKSSNSRYLTSPDNTIDHIIIRVSEDDYSGNILFGFKKEGKIKYDVLILGFTELGVVPTEFVNNQRKIDLFNLLELNDQDPYQKDFKLIEKYMNDKGSNITSEYLGYLYYTTKEFMVKKGMNPDDVYFLEKHKGVPYLICNF